MKAVRLIAIAMLLSMLLGASVAQASFVDQAFNLIKSVHPQPDSVEFARYYVTQPLYASTIYARLAAQDYAFAAILGAAKAARDQPILPGGAKFGYQQCRAPMTLFDAIFAKNDKFIAEYGKEDHIKAYLTEKNGEAKQEALAQVVEYVPYLSDVDAICDFTFHTSFKTEEDIRKAAMSNWQLAKGMYEDLASGNVAGLVAKLIEAGVSGDAACTFADSALTGGTITKTPVLGALAKNVCSGFAGTVIKGIATAVGGFVNAVGEFIGDAACSIGIGSCSGNQPLDTFFNRNFQLLVYNYAIDRDVDPDQWTTHWWNTIMGEHCRNATGASASACEQQFNQVVGSAKSVATRLRLEPRPAYESIYKPAVDHVARLEPSAQKFLLMRLNDACVDNLVTLYPWPGPQQMGPESYNEVFRLTCAQARTRADIADGKSFDQQVAERTAFFKKALDTTGCEGNSAKRVCRSYPSQFACGTVFEKFGVPRGAAMTTNCLVDPVAAAINMSKQVGAEAPQCKPVMIPGHLDVFLTDCATYEDHAACVKTVKGTNGAPASLYLGCRLNSAAAKKAAIDTMLLSMAIGSSLGNNDADGCKLTGSAFRCGSDGSFAQCKSLLAKQRGVPTGVITCLRNVVLPGGTTIPSGGHVLDKTPGSSSNPGTGHPGVAVVPHPQATTPAATTDAHADLRKRGCTESASRPGVFACSSRPAYDACQSYRAKKQANGCVIPIRTE